MANHVKFAAATALLFGVFDASSRATLPIRFVCDGSCAVADYAMAPGGTTATISPVSLGQPHGCGGAVPRGWATVRSTNPQVATIAASSLVVTSGQPGSTEIEFIGEDGKVLESATLYVTDALPKLVITKGWQGDVPKVLPGANAILSIEQEMTGGSRPIVNLDQVAKVSLDGTLVEETSAPSDRVSPAIQIGFHGSEGAGTITASAGDSTVQQRIDIVPVSAITHITLPKQVQVAANPVPPSSQMTTTGPRPGSVAVAFSAESDSVPVYGASCSWSFSDPAVTASDTTFGALSASARSGVAFQIAQPGSYTATCTLGSASATLQLDYPK